MTEEQWLTGTDPTPMLTFLRCKASDRKLRLFACTCCWTIIHLGDDRCRGALAVAEQFADGLTTAAELETAWGVANDVYCELQGVPESVADAVAVPCSLEDLERDVIQVTSTAQALAAVGVERSMIKASRILAQRKQSRWLRDIIGNPFRPVAIVPAWLLPSVLSLAHAAYHHRSLPFGTLDNDRLAVLADALEDADCTDLGLLGHLRNPGSHVRGCWAVDLILAKNR